MHRRRITKQSDRPSGTSRIVSSSKRSSKSSFQSLFKLTSIDALVILIICRLASAAFNIIHDCDEVFNYWEPLHYAIYGSGMQTWEYSSAFALRSWWYLLLHALIGAPASFIFGSFKGKVAVFYTIKAALSLLSAITEWFLYRAVASRYSTLVSNTFLALLCVSSGMFVSASALLPSSFTMYFVTAAAAAILENNSKYTIISAVIGVIWGWCVAGLAFLPYALHILVSSPLLKSIGILFGSLFATLAPLIVSDRYYYGTWKASLLNFLEYNVAGGGQSALYGVEGPLYYLKNGFNQLQFVLPLSLMLPFIIVFTWLGQKIAGFKSKKRFDAAFFIAISPFYIWFAAITALEHKEERFLYVVYPLACLAAAASLEYLCDAVNFICRSSFWCGRIFVISTVIVTQALSISRSIALVVNYGAPMLLYTHLSDNENAVSSLSNTIQLPSTLGAKHHMKNTNNTHNVCVGAEWYRYPSAFFLPGPHYHLHFMKSGFTGLLPREFDKQQGGPRFASPYLNDKNREEPENYWKEASQCDYAVTLTQETATYTTEWIDSQVLGSEDDWHVEKELNFLDSARSPALTRAFFIPRYSNKKNAWLKYVLLRRKQNTTKKQ